MERAARFVLLLAALWAVSQAFPTAHAALTLAQRLQQLGLGSAGNRPTQWLERLGVFEGRPARERLLVVNGDGLIVHSLDGEEAHVKITADVDDELRREGADLVLVHNHPNSSGLSKDDLSQLGKAGVAAVIAIGHDGSVYAAARGPRFDLVVCGGDRYSNVREDVQRTLLREADAADVARLTESFSPHLAALVLARSRYIEYIACLAPDRQASFERDRPVFGRVIASVSAKLDARKD